MAWQVVMKVILASLLVLLGGALVYGGLTTVHGDTSEWLRISKVTNGRVIDVVREGDGRGANYFPIVEFTPSARVPVVFRAHTQNSYLESYAAGDMVMVRYNPDDPTQAKINTGVRNWGPLIIVVAVGASLALCGILILFKSVKSYKGRTSTVEIK